MKIKLPVLFLSLLFNSKIHAQISVDNEIRAFKKADSMIFPPENGILFIGKRYCCKRQKC